MHYQSSRELGQHLLRRRWCLALAESCTGGGLSAAVTAVSGSSAWFDRSFVTYQAEAKIESLGVSEAVIHEYGQVSAETAQAMADGALNHSHAQLALSITGIAGPDGGSDQKPVGLVFFGLALRNEQTLCRQYQFDGDRQTIRDSAIAFALSWLIDFLKKEATT